MAIVTHCDENGLATLSLRNKFSAGDEIEIVGPDFKPLTFTAPMMTDQEGKELSEVRTPQAVFRMQLPCTVPAWSILRHQVDLSAK